jgi:cytochrome c nitrite reductase small subunit
MSTRGFPVSAGRLLPFSIAVLASAAFALATFTFVYAKGYSYVTNNPAACANCHIMSDHYSAWLASSHRAVAVCNDCHTPHDPAGKYSVKARNGFWHSFYFTTGGFRYPLAITPRNFEVAESACRKCHDNIIAAMNAAEDSPPDDARGRATRRGVACTHCHRGVGHWVRG